MLASRFTKNVAVSTAILRPLAIATVLTLPAAAVAHEDPPGCFQTGPAIVISVLRADGTTGLTGNVSECETINYRATLKKAATDDGICAFSGGTFSLTTPDGVVHDINLNVPCIGGTISPCDDSVESVQSALIPYSVSPGDVAGGLITATATYAGGVAHDRPTDTPGISAMAPKATPAVLCDDDDACTQNVCDPNVRGAAACSNPPVDCNDNDACTNDACGDGVCSHVAPDPQCVPCVTAADCNDDNACTTDTCPEGICVHTTPDPSCVPCDSPADCNDHNACTTDTCPEGVCRHVTPDPTCIPCETAAQCNDNDTCTTDTCSAAGICARTPIPGCPIEICDDGVDNDGDGDVDCADSDCANNPLCPPEICENCLDDDHDGLIDLDDDDCGCDNPATLVLRKMSVRSLPEVGKNKIRVKARYASQAPEGFDPGLQGTTMQIRDSEGTLYCHTIPFKSDRLWTRMGVWMFRDKTGLMAAGLRHGKFKVFQMTNGRVMFKTSGKKMTFREPAGSQVTVTLRVGTDCKRVTTALRTGRARKGKKLIFP